MTAFEEFLSTVANARREHFKLKLLVMGLLMIIPGLIVTKAGARLVWEDYAAFRWPTVPGKIIKSGLEMKQDDKPNAAAWYSLIVEFRYSVGDRNYISNHFSTTSFMTTDRDEADRVLSQFPVGKTVTVHYNPARPEAGILQPEISSFSLIVLGLGLFASVFGLGVGIFFYRRKRQRLAAARASTER